MKKNTTKPIALLTDFGLDDTFVGIMKAVIYQITPQAKIIDLSHSVDPQNIEQASFLLLTSYKYFAQETIFCVVVDPEVGSDRLPILIETTHYTFVGPDNGVLSAAAYADGILRITHLQNPAYFLDPVSKTFHGRDIFAPVCAHLSNGNLSSNVFGPKINSFKKLELLKVQPMGKDMELSVIHIDHFGNIILNLTNESFIKSVNNNDFILIAGNVNITRHFDTYITAEDNEPFLVAASSGYVEISLKNANAAHFLKIQISDKVVLKINQTSS